MPSLQPAPRPRRRTGWDILIICIAVIALLGVFLFESRQNPVATGNYPLIINEVMASNSSVIADEDGDYPDWIEIYNPGDEAVDLEGCGLSDNSNNPLKWVFPKVTVQPKEYLLVFASGKDKRDPNGSYLHTNFKINASRDFVFLSARDGQFIDSIEVRDMDSDVSYGRLSSDSDAWHYFTSPTPAMENPQSGDGALPAQGGQVENPQVVINEYMVSNNVTMVDEDGDFSDWIEIYNRGSTAVSLEGYGLSDEEGTVFKWCFPNITLEAGQYVVVFASGKDRRDPQGPYLHTNFRLDANGEVLLLCNKEGGIMDKLGAKAVPSDISVGRSKEDGETWLFYTSPTPGDDNYTQGFTSLPGGISRNERNHVIISEVCALNRSTLPDEDGDYPDWIELYNPKDTPVNLKDYGLSEDNRDLFKWRFPDMEIGPKSYLVVFASDKDRRDVRGGGHLHTNFHIGASGDRLFLTRPDGIVSDSFATGKLTADTSSGRRQDTLQRFFFNQPTPGAANSGKAYTAYALPPEFSKNGGFYDEPLSLSLKAMDASAEIRYTLDGSEPDEQSAVYTGPIDINKTAVVRARAFGDGLLPSDIQTHTFFINAHHDLPVVSICTNPDNLWDYNQGIFVKGPGAAEEFPYVGANFWKDMEKEIHMELFDEEGRLGLSMDAGMKVFGAYGRAMDKKSLAVHARNIYGTDSIRYPFFHDKDILDFKSIVLRTSGQDATMSKIRDGFITTLARRMGLDAQAYRPAVLYINGEYWGLYNLREKINEHFIASNHGVDIENIDLLEANGRVKFGQREDYDRLIDFVKNNDLSRSENYEYVKSQVDIQNFIDYEIAIMYFANTDSGNIRFWRERGPEGRWRWIVYDQDWAFFDVNHNTVWYLTNPKGHGIGQMFSNALMHNLMKNKEFKEEFVARFAYHLKNTFKPEDVIALIDEFAARIESEVSADCERWGGTFNGWKVYVQSLRDFAAKRPAIIKKYIQQELGLSNEEMKIFDGI